MKEYKPLIIIMSLFVSSILLQAQTTEFIYVSAKGNPYVHPEVNSKNLGTIHEPFDTLHSAYKKIQSESKNKTVQMPYDIILLGDNDVKNAIYIRNDGKGEHFTWDISGTKSYPIRIYPQNKAIIIRNESSTQHMIKLLNVSHISFSNIEFRNSSYGFLLDNADYCTIQYCRFIGDPIEHSSGSGTIWIGKKGIKKEDQFSKDNYNAGNEEERSSNNIIKNNYFVGMINTSSGNWQKSHNIYISHGSDDNDVYFNTMDLGFFWGTGILLNHSYMKNNNVRRNFINIDGIDYGRTQKNALVIGFEENDDLSKIIDNNVVGNYLYNTGSSSKELISIESDTKNSIVVNNTIKDNISKNGKELTAHDPLWLGYKPDRITGRVISGDFDEDGSLDDIAAFYDYGKGETRIHLWETEKNNFRYLGADGAWSSFGYYSENISDLTVSGDFDNDGYKDDIAAFYDYGSGETRIHTWLFNGTYNFFKYSGADGVWSTPAGYHVSKISARVLSGDFDNDGFEDDIAALYDYGSKGTRIHVWYYESGKFEYSGSLGKWSNDQYRAGNIAGRVVSGDFDHDGFKDDIIAICDYGNNETRIHAWLSDGNYFKFEGVYGRWNSKIFNSDNIIEQIVCGDFDGDGNKGDLAAFYQKDNGELHLYSWISNGIDFACNVDNSWWSSLGYSVDKIAGRIISGDFDKYSNKSAITTFYDYSSQNGNLRTCMEEYR